MDYFLGERLYSKETKAGLKIYVVPKPEFSKVFAMYSTHYGSIDSEFIEPGLQEHLKVPEGIAHFLEHKMFEMEYGNVFDKFAELGTSSNAFTTYNNTTYLFSATSLYEENLRLLLDFVDTPYFMEDSVEKEKGIIAQELRMYEDEPEWQVLLNLIKNLYHHHPVRIDIGGTVESIQKIDSALLYKCYNTFYHPSNMVLFVIGCIEPDEVFRIVEEHEQAMNRIPQGEIERKYPKEPMTICQAKSSVKLDVSEPLFLMGFKDSDIGYDGPKLLKKELVTGIILEIILGRSSELYEKLYEQGLIDDRFNFGYEGQKDYGFCTIGGETRDPAALYETLKNGIAKIVEQGFEKEAFTRVKKRYMGDFVQGFNSLEFIASTFIAYHHKKINIFDYMRVLEEITMEDVMARLKSYFDFSRCAVSLVLPK